MNNYSGFETGGRIFRPVRLVPRQHPLSEGVSVVETQTEPQRAFFVVQNILSMAADPRQEYLFTMQNWNLSRRESRQDIPGPFLPATIASLQKAAEILDGQTTHEQVRQRLITELETYFHPQGARKGNRPARWHERLETANTLALIAPDVVAAYERYEQTLPFDAYSHDRFREFREMSPQDIARDAEIIRNEVPLRWYGYMHPWYQHENDEALGNLQLRHLRILNASPSHRELLAVLREYDREVTAPQLQSIAV